MIRRRNDDELCGRIRRLESARVGFGDLNVQATLDD